MVCGKGCLEVHFIEVKSHVTLVSVIHIFQVSNTSILSTWWPSVYCMLHGVILTLIVIMGCDCDSLDIVINANYTV